MGSFAAGAGTQFLVTSGSGGGTFPGPFTVAAGTATANTPALNVTQTWNNAAVTFTGWRFNVTDTASNAASLLMDLQVGGGSRFSVTKSGTVNINLPATNTSALNVTAGGGGVIASFNQVAIQSTGSSVTFGTTNFGPFTIGSIGTGQTVIAGSTNNPIVLAPLFNITEQRNGTNAQTFRLYGTFTDISNYRRVSLDMTTAGVGTLRPEGLGTGASGNILVLSTGATTVASLPTASTAGAGARAFVTDATVTTFASTVVGGGANAVPVVSNGTNWIIG